MWAYLKYLISTVYAADTSGSGGSQTITIPNPLSCSDATCVLKSILAKAWIIAAPICTLMVLVGAFQILTAAGNEEKFKKGRQTILYAAIGFGLVVLASGIPAIIQDLLGDSTGAPALNGFMDTLTRVMNWGFTFLLAFSVLFILYAAFLYVTANGDSEKVSRANRVILYAAIAVAVAVLAKAVPMLVIDLLGGGSGPGPAAPPPPGLRV